MNKFTRGPWGAAKHGDYSDYNGRCIVVLGDDCTVRVAVVLGGNDEETNATARLIAAAPELLDGLKHLYRAYVSTLELARYRILELGGECAPLELIEQGDPALIKTRELIAKATGESQ